MKRKKLIRFLTILIAIAINALACNVKESLENVRFDFTAYQSSTHSDPNEIEIRGTLINDNLHSIYYLRTSYFLECDTSEFEVVPIILCQGSPVQEIKPKSKLDFRASCINKRNATEIKLGFHFLEVDKNFDISKMNPHDVINRVENDVSIIWADKKQITAYPNIVSNEEDELRRLNDSLQ